MAFWIPHNSTNQDSLAVTKLLDWAKVGLLSVFPQKDEQTEKTRAGAHLHVTEWRTAAHPACPSKYLFSSLATQRFGLFIWPGSRQRTEIFYDHLVSPLLTAAAAGERARFNVQCSL